MEPKYQSLGNGRFWQCACCLGRVDSFVELPVREVYSAGHFVGYKCDSCFEAEMFDVLSANVSHLNAEHKAV